MEAMRIDFEIVSCPLGELLVAATDRGLCSVRLGDDAGALEEGLRAEFPHALVRRRSRGVARLSRELRALARGRPARRGLPLDLRPSRFQRRVWDAIRAIPHGSTCSYAALARRVGRPGAARAVARACATNPVALAIPCHRVVLRDGGCGGYRWGVERKRALLAAERTAANPGAAGR